MNAASVKGWQRRAAYGAAALAMRAVTSDSRTVTSAGLALSMKRRSSPLLQKRPSFLISTTSASRSASSSAALIDRT